MTDFFTELAKEEAREEKERVELLKNSTKAWRFFHIFINLITVAFVILKLTNAITWSWLGVLMPTIIWLGFMVVMTIAYIVLLIIRACL